MRWLLLLVLPSALGLLGFGLVGLVGNARQLREDARGEARAAARAEARSLRQAVEARTWREVPMADGRWFRVSAERELELPLTLGPLEESALISPTPAFLSHPIREVLTRAAALEFEARDVPGAIATLEEAADLAQDDEDRAALAARLAWCAHRHDDESRRDAAIARAFALEAPGRDEELSVTLVAFLAGRDVATRLQILLMGIPEAEATLCLDRLRDLDPARTKEFETRLREAMGLRRRLRIAATRLPPAGSTEHFLVEAVDGDLLLLYSADRYFGPATWELALLPPATVIEAAGFDPARFVIGAAPPEDAIPALPMVAALPARFDAAEGSAELGFTAVLLVGIAIAFVVGLLLAARALRREALAARARSEFLTSVTHELKTPLASIRLIAEMLEQGIVKEPARRDEYHRLLSGETARLTMLIENVLDLGRMERGERAYDRRRESPVEVVRAAVEVFRPIAQRDGLELAARLDAVGAEAEIDRGALVQALLNLLENARKYALAGGRIEIADEFRDRLYRLRLRDFGPGIPEDELEAVFERFKRGRAQADGRVAGVGLGLHLARRIVEDHGGRLRAEKPGDGAGGALFILEIPVTTTEVGS